MIMCNMDLPHLKYAASFKLKLNIPARTHMDIPYPGKIATFKR